MSVFCLISTIAASFLFHQAESKQFWSGDYGTTNPCNPNPCTPGYKCDIDDQGPFCYNPGQTIRQTYNVNSNNNYDDPAVLRWILRLIKLLATILKQPAADNSPKLHDPCVPNPCGFKGKCSADKTQKTSCKCPFPTGGDKCEQDLGGCGNCTRQGQLVVFLLNENKMNWDDALATCKSKNLTLYSPKSKQLSDFGRSYMLDLESQHQGPSTNYSYWLGARRDTEYAYFVWEDDKSEVDHDFEPWFGQKPKDGDFNCLETSSGAGFDFSWDNEDCTKDQQNGFQHYPACAGTFDFYST